MNLPKLIGVVWVDTQTTAGWRQHPDEIKPAIIVSTGFILEDGEKLLKISPTIIASGGSHFADGTVIPKGCILFSKTFSLEWLEKWINRFLGEK